MKASDIKDIVQQATSLRQKLHALSDCNLRLNIAHCDRQILIAAEEQNTKVSITLGTFDETLINAVHEHYKKNGFNITRTACNGFDIDWL
jgi:hypothetical protein